MTQPEKKPKPSFGQRLKAFGARLLHMLLNNLPLKLLALAVATVLWAGLISQDASLTREKTFTDVSISVVGAETLKRNGFVVTGYVSEGLDSATMVVSVPQTQYQSASPSSYNPRIDLSRIRKTGEQELPVTFTTTQAMGSVVSISPASVTVEVDSYITRYRIPLTLTTTGTLPAGFWSTTPSTDPPYVSISGPARLVRSVVRGTAVMDLSTLPAQSGQVSTAVSFELYDSTGAVVDSSMMEITSDSMRIDSVLISQTLYPTKLVHLADQAITAGTPARGYAVSAVRTSPQTVTIAAAESALETLDQVFTIGTVSVDGADTTFQAELRLRKPSEVAWLSTDTVAVIVEIAPVIETVSFSGVRLNMTGLETGMSANLPVKSVLVRAAGPLLTVEKLKQAQLRVYVDLSGITEPGVYDLPVQVRLSTEGDESLTLTADPAAISVEISRR